MLNIVLWVFIHSLVYKGFLVNLHKLQTYSNLTDGQTGITQSYSKQDSFCLASTSLSLTVFLWYNNTLLCPQFSGCSFAETSGCWNHLWRWWIVLSLYLSNKWDLSWYLYKPPTPRAFQDFASPSENSHHWRWILILDRRDGGILRVFSHPRRILLAGPPNRHLQRKTA